MKTRLSESLAECGWWPFNIAYFISRNRLLTTWFVSVTNKDYARCALPQSHYKIPLLTV